MNIASSLVSVSKRVPDALAVSGPAAEWTYDAFSRRMAGLASALRGEYGLDYGDRVVLCMENCTQYLEALFACWTAGVCAVPVNAKLHVKEIQFIVDNAAAKAIVCTEPFYEAMRDVSAAAPSRPEVIVAGSDSYERLTASDPLSPVAVSPEDLAWIFYTSGTTGRPKGAMLSHRNLLFMSLCYYADIDRVEVGDSNLHYLAISHGSGLYAIPHMLRGGHQVVRKAFDPALVYEDLMRYRNATIFMVPTVLKRFIDAPAAADADTSNLKTIWYGGSPPYAADPEHALDLLGPKLLQVYAQGETPNTCTYLSKETHGDRGTAEWAERIRSCGVARAGVAFRVVDAEDRDLPLGEVGEVITRSDCVMQGYWNNPEASEETLRGGWLHTGDLGSLDAHGYLTLQDRSKDVIISGGSNIYPREIEEVLQRHPGVKEVSVVGRPGGEWGEDVIAFVVRAEGEDVDEPALDALCLDNVARFKRPKAYRFIDELPKSAYGKILKRELRDKLLAETKDQPE